MTTPRTHGRINDVYGKWGKTSRAYWSVCVDSGSHGRCMREHKRQEANCTNRHTQTSTMQRKANQTPAKKAARGAKQRRIQRARVGLRIDTKGIDTKGIDTNCTSRQNRMARRRRTQQAQPSRTVHSANQARFARYLRTCARHWEAGIAKVATATARNSTGLRQLTEPCGGKTAM